MKNLFLFVVVSFFVFSCNHTPTVTTENGQQVVHLPCDKKFVSAAKGGHTTLSYVYRSMRPDEYQETFTIHSEGLEEVDVTFIESRCAVPTASPSASCH